ncbi:MAG TPA: glutamyl-tRNA reductase [Acidimicrobiia bacterium]|nr:glutamyl-tRNA reductase [Acidimicrobiia bacterium]
MSLLVVGLNHRTVPVELLERLSVAPEDLPKALHALMRREHLAEAVLLSTCNRTEVYAHATLFHPAMQDVRDFLADTSGVDPDEFADLLYAYHDDAAVSHLFAVAAGLDSMIIGEGEILGQVREAWQVAEREAASGSMLDRTFRHAIEVGKRARTDTGIGRHAVSVSSAAVSLATNRLGSLDDRRVLVIGAGAMGEGMALALAGAGVREIVVANRTVSRAEELAARVHGRAITLDGITESLVDCDVVLVSTGAPDILVERAAVERVMTSRNGRALLVVDIGVPRNIDPGAGEVFGVTLLDIDDLRAYGELSLEQRRQEIGKVRDLIAEELDRHRIERKAREVAPLVTALRSRAEELRTAELRRSRARLSGLSPADRDAVDALTQALVNKLLHEPTVRLKDAAGSARGALYADVLVELFGLPEPEPDADADE